MMPTPLPAVQSARRPWRMDVLILALLTAGVLSAWHISRREWFLSGEDLRYDLGVVGGVMLLLVFLYPLRKHVRGLHGWGQARSWLWVHIAFGLVGPWLILLHSTFRLGSLNATVALVSMLVVVASGVIGRFLYIRVHRGLDAERQVLLALRRRASLGTVEGRSWLHFAPQVEADLLAFETEVTTPGRLAGAFIGPLLWLPLRQARLRRRCRRALRPALAAHADAQGLSIEERQRRRRKLHALVGDHLAAVVRVAQFDAMKRVFALWHVAHLPFVLLLLVSAVVHVVAVHAY
jgi:hypothetical protein